MPCDREITISVEMRNLDVELMRSVLAEMGLDWRVSVEKHRLVGSEEVLTQERLGKIKKAYAEGVVRKQAKRLGWRVQKEKDGKLKVSR